MPRDFPGSPGTDPSIIGGAFRDTVWVLRHDGLRTIALSILLLTPIEAMTVWLQAHTPGKPYSPLAIAFALSVGWPLHTAFLSLFIGGLAWRVDRLLHGHRASLRDTARHGLRRWPTMMGIEMVCGAAMLGGLVLLIVPGLMITTRWLVAPQVAAIEGLGLRDALARSDYLTKGWRWSALGVFAIEMVGYYGGYYAIQLPLYAMGGSLLREPIPMMLNQYLFTSLHAALFMGLSVIFYTAFFHRLVAARGLKGETAAQVFD